MYFLEKGCFYKVNYENYVPSPTLIFTNYSVEQQNGKSSECDFFHPTMRGIKNSIIVSVQIYE